MKLKRNIVILGLTALLAASVWFWQTQTVRAAPPVSFKTIKGQNITPADLRGKPVLVTFWATDCPGCIEEIPHLIELHGQYSAQGLNIIAVAMSYDPPNHVVAMAESKQLPYAVALDPGGALAQQFGNVQLTPTTFLIDREGRIVLQKVGVFELRDMQQRLNRL
ncbi:TlpA family protein disulfide reductase [Methylomonas sp. SURF-2]|uniref:TlpA family protein disulfide reductase n=1 Tax=Methylomonas subterranea TaxID=2952225 RepID=A0ABT1TD14_9GAMM|nr:TlpA disulfide reductase family protein [Methylomonas sp. SURF-2]MCQ8103320.1 TlpA family protein disulfide reductase [Methylomonas sp. SURF-2]